MAWSTLFACGGSDSASLFTEIPDGGAATALEASTAATDAVPQASADGARPEGGRDASKADPRILPLELGRRWTFESKALSGSTTECVGTQTAEVVGKGATREGKPSLRYLAICFPYEGFVELQPAGDRWLAYFVDTTGNTTGGPLLYLDTPITEGHEWQYGSNGTTFSWHDVGTVTVPAGTYSSCWRRELNGTKDWVIFCRGVGQVKHHYETEGFEAVLTGVNF